MQFFGIFCKKFPHLGYFFDNMNSELQNLEFFQEIKKKIKGLALKLTEIWLFKDMV